MAYAAAFTHHAAPAAHAEPGRARFQLIGSAEKRSRTIGMVLRDAHALDSAVIVKDRAANTARIRTKLEVARIEALRMLERIDEALATCGEG